MPEPDDMLNPMTFYPHLSEMSLRRLCKARELACKAISGKENSGDTSHLIVSRMLIEAVDAIMADKSVTEVLENNFKREFERSQQSPNYAALSLLLVISELEERGKPAAFQEASRDIELGKNPPTQAIAGDIQEKEIVKTIATIPQTAVNDIDPRKDVKDALNQLINEVDANEPSPNHDITSAHSALDSSESVENSSSGTSSHQPTPLDTLPDIALALPTPTAPTTPSGHFEYACASWNCNSVTNKLGKTISYITEHSLDILGLCETKCDPLEEYSELSCGGNYTAFRCDNASNSGGVALIVNKLLKPTQPFSKNDQPLSYKYSHVETTSPNSKSPPIVQVQMVSCRVELSPSSALLVVCIYRNGYGVASKFNECLTRVRELRDADKTITHVLVMGDFNLPKADWVKKTHPGGDDYAKCAGHLFKFAQDLKLTQIVQEITFVRATKNYTSESLLDLLFTSDLQLIPPHRCSVVESFCPHADQKKNGHKIVRFPLILTQPLPASPENKVDDQQDRVPAV